VSCILPFPLVFALKETSGRPEISRKRSGEKRSHYGVASAFGGVQQHRNTKHRTQAKQMLDKGGDYVEIELKVCAKSFLTEFC
jgi:hypothetical protein